MPGGWLWEARVLLLCSSDSKQLQLLRVAMAKEHIGCIKKYKETSHTVPLQHNPLIRSYL